MEKGACELELQNIMHACMHAQHLMYWRSHDHLPLFRWVIEVLVVHSDVEIAARDHSGPYAIEVSR